MTVLSALGAFLVGGLGWLALEFLGRPLRKFFDLRQEIARQLILHAAVRAKNDLEDKYADSDPKRIQEVKRLYRDLGSQLIAFGNGERPTSDLLRRFGINSVIAGEQLLWMGLELDEGANIIQRRNEVMKNLKMKY